jgi:hypothetical protein
VAKLIALNKQIPAVSISGPGVYFSGEAKTTQDMYMLIRNVIPARDYVPMLGKQEGTIVNIPCEYSQCHSISVTIKTLEEICGPNV